MRAINIIPSANQVIFHVTLEEFDKEFKTKKDKALVVETETQKVFTNDLEYIYCDKK